MASLILVGNKNNILSSSMDVTAHTITISNCTAFDLTATDMVSVYDTTTSTTIPLWPITGCTRVMASGLPTFVYQFSKAFPAGTANGDTLLIMLSIPPQFTDFLVQQYIAGATI